MSTPTMAALAPPIAVPARPRAAAAPQRSRRALGKYREILIAVAFFLLFDLAVLVLNFVVSYEIAQDAVAINLAGRQRMLTQRMAKTLFALEVAQARGQPTEPLLDELRTAVNLFDGTLLAFRQGGTATGGDGKPLSLSSAGSAAGLAILQRADTLWQPWRQRIEPLRSVPSPDLPLISAAADHARQHNLALLGLMNEFTTALESDANGRAARLRQVQTAGIVLALVNFLFILFKFIRRLRRSDAAIEEATEENREILASVREGLFLLTPELHLGTQLSQSVSGLFGRSVRPGDSFIGLLQPVVSAKTLADARDYLELLFTPHVREELVQSINPLSEVELSITDSLGQPARRHLAFQFNRVIVEQQVRHLLVTVQDVSARVELEQQLQGERQRAQREFDLLVKAFEAEPAALRRFVERSESSLLQVNDMLSQVAAEAGPRQVERIVNAMCRHVHAVKGEASMLGLDLLSATAHAFESRLQALRESGEFGGESLLALPVSLEELLTRVQALKRLAQTGRGVRQGTEDGALPDLGTQIAALVRRITVDTGKQARVQHDTAALARLPTRLQDALTRIAVQLARNAMTHGIEAPEQRLRAGKPEEGTVGVRLELAEDGTMDLVVHDDGAGLDLQRVRQRLLELGWYHAAQIDEMSPQQLLGHIFKAGFSTALAVDEHSGRGIGLEVVTSHVRELGGRLLVSSQRWRGTEFRVRFSA